MITESDKKVLNEIKEFISKHENTDETRVDWQKVEWQGLLQRIEYNLSIAPLSYRKASKADKVKRFYTADCAKCGWWGSSRLLLGGGALADTGDYDDVSCPVCDNKDIGERS